MKLSTRHALRDFAKELKRRAKSATVRGSQAASTELATALMTLGVTKGDTLLLFADEAELAKALPLPRLSGLLGDSFRDRLLDDVRGVLGPSGTLVLPLEFGIDPKRLSHSGRPFDSRRSHSIGLGGRLRGTPDSHCSVAPVLALVAVGRDAGRLMGGQTDAAPFPMGRGSPWEKLLQKGAKVAMVGRSLVNTPLLLPAHLRNQRYERPSFFHRPFQFRVVTEDGKTVDTRFNLHACPFQAHYDLAGYADYKTFMAYLDEKYGLYSHAKIGSLDIALYSYSRQYELLEVEIDAGVYLEDARYW